jgi:hypothetical protein
MLPPDLVAKLNECANTNFIGPRDFWFAWLSRFTTLVAIGLAFELPELVYELAAIARDWIGFLKYRVMLSESHMQLAKVVAFIGWFLIVGGVVGERVAEVKVRNFDTSVQECSDAKVRAATIEAGDAAASAKTAHDEADAVKGIADEARADAKDALAKAQKAQRELAHAEADAVKAQTVASKALSTAAEADSRVTEAMRGANELAAKIDRLTTPRHLFHKTKIASPLKAFPGAEYVFIGTCEDQECFDLVSDIDELLEFAGWKRIKSPGMRLGIAQFLSTVIKTLRLISVYP